MEVVGTWASVEFRETTQVTTKAAQAVADPSRPGQGSIRLSGAFAGEAAYAFVERSEGGMLFAAAYTFPHIQKPWPSSGAYLVVSSIGVHAVVMEGATTTSYVYASGGAPLPIMVTGERIVVPRVLLTAQDGRTLAVEGTLRPAQIALAAGVATNVRTYRAPDELGRTVRLHFGADNTFSSQSLGFDGDAQPSQRRWMRLAPDRIQTTFPNGTLWFEWQAQRQGEMLVLGRFLDECTPALDVPCVRRTEERFALPPGSVVRSRRLVETALRPAP